MAMSGLCRCCRKTLPTSSRFKLWVCSLFQLTGSGTHGTPLLILAGLWFPLPMFCLAPATVVVTSRCCSRLGEISSDLYGHLGCRPCVSRFRRGTMLPRGRPHFSYRTAPYPTSGILTGEREVQWNPLPVYAGYEGMRNELPYIRPPAVQVARPQNRYRLHAAPVPVT